MKLYTITDDKGRIRTFSYKSKLAWRSTHWVLYRLRRLDRSRYDVHICDLDTGVIEKVNAHVFYEMYTNPKVTEAEIENILGVKISLSALKHMYDEHLLSDTTRSLVKVYLESKHII